MIHSYDLQYIINTKHNKYILLHLLGSILIDPWNCNDTTIQTNYSNNRQIPDTVEDILNLWVHNRIFAQKEMDNIPISTCYCGNYIYLHDINITETPKFPTHHRSCLSENELDDICNAFLENVKIINDNVEEIMED
jgi:hypothetical protein